MTYQELPGIPGIWVDYAAGSLPGLSSLLVLPNMQSLRAQAESVKKRQGRREALSHILPKTTDPATVLFHDCARGPGRPEAVVVVTEIQASLFGGPASHLLKCLTAIKVCRELAKYGVPAVPVCWIGPSEGSAGLSTSLLDDQGEFHRLRLQHQKSDFSPADPLPAERVTELLKQIEALGRGGFAAETVEILRSAYCPGATLASGTARLMSALMKEWGMISLDPQAPDIKPALTGAREVLRHRIAGMDATPPEQDSGRSAEGLLEHSPGCSTPAFLDQNLVLPVAANVIGPWELHPFLEMLPVLDALDLPRPVAWPQTGATLVDVRSRRTLEKYGLGIRDLFSGEKEVTAKIKRTIPKSAPGRLKELALEAGLRMADLGGKLPPGDQIARTRDSCSERIIYQIEKLRERCEAACARKEAAAERQIHKTCNRLAPEGKTQESGLSGIQFLLRHSLSVLQLLYERLDLTKFEHQLISMD